MWADRFFQSINFYIEKLIVVFVQNLNYTFLTSNKNMLLSNFDCTYFLCKTKFLDCLNWCAIPQIQIALNCTGYSSGTIKSKPTNFFIIITKVSLFRFNWFCVNGPLGESTTTCTNKCSFIFKSNFTNTFFRNCGLWSSPSVVYRYILIGTTVRN